MLNWSLADTVEEANLLMHGSRICPGYDATTPATQCDVMQHLLVLQQTGCHDIHSFQGLQGQVTEYISVFSPVCRQHNAGCCGLRRQAVHAWPPEALLCPLHHNCLAQPFPLHTGRTGMPEATCKLLTDLQSAALALDQSKTCPAAPPRHRLIYASAVSEVGGAYSR